METKPSLQLRFLFPKQSWCLRDKPDLRSWRALSRFIPTTERESLRYATVNNQDCLGACARAGFISTETKLFAQAFMLPTQPLQPAILQTKHRHPSTRFLSHLVRRHLLCVVPWLAWHQWHQWRHSTYPPCLLSFCCSHNKTQHHNTFNQFTNSN